MKRNTSIIQITNRQEVDAATRTITLEKSTVSLSMLQPRQYIHPTAQRFHDALMVGDLNQLKLTGRAVHCTSGTCEYSSKQEVQHRITWGIPNPQALRYIAAHSKAVLDVGAGCGYWSAWLQHLGCAAIPISQPESYWHLDAEPSFAQHHRYQHFVQAHRQFPAEDMLLVWPPLNRPLGAEVVNRLQVGQSLYYQGEWSDGCTGSDAFFELLAEKCREVKRLPAYSWSGYDSFYHYVKVKE